ncbi:MAG: class I SAM-dependent DNA methyltransferase, partial [Deltaproteobacteria bacterium]|nr:class I SAM-dependent DNA methyltransferase [Deltaproteobacteria bacterium]
FGIKTFRWSNEAAGKAAVYCVIIGFSCLKTDRDVNQYLLPAPAVFIESRQHPLGSVPPIGIGNKPIDGGHYLFTGQEKENFLKTEPLAEKWFRRWAGGDEFLYGYSRWCLWLGACPPDELHKMPEALKLVKKVQEFRLRSPSLPTRKLAERPARFHVENMPDGSYIAIPKVTTDRRTYIPIGFLNSETLASDLLFLMPGATLYHFSILTSSVHMAWVRAVCGRLGTGLRYSKDIVYNNFPWPCVSEEQKDRLMKLAQAIIDIRLKHPSSSLAHLYDPLSMPQDLLSAHQKNDQAVLKAYGFSGESQTEAGCFKALIERYQMICQKSVF